MAKCTTSSWRSSQKGTWRPGSRLIGCGRRGSRSGGTGGSITGVATEGKTACSGEEVPARGPVRHDRGEHKCPRSRGLLPVYWLEGLLLRRPARHGSRRGRILHKEEGGYRAVVELCKRRRLECRAVGSVPSPGAGAKAVVKVVDEEGTA